MTDTELNIHETQREEKNIRHQMPIGYQTMLHLFNPLLEYQILSHLFDSLAIKYEIVPHSDQRKYIVFAIKSVAQANNNYHDKNFF